MPDMDDRSAFSHDNQKDEELEMGNGGWEIKNRAASELRLVTCA